MAKPRVFVSSTYYDLKHLRSSLENFIEELGYEAVLSEKDSIAYLPDIALDESCYREARNSDIFVLIIGGRYGSAASSEARATHGRDFYEAYESITKQEYKNACERGIPTYICIEAAVDAEYHTYLKNKDREDFEYAHVDSKNIFSFIESIRNEPKNNPIKLFTRYSEIESWLKEQWAGYFRELIGRQSSEKEIEDIGKRIGDLAATTETLKRYLEQVISRVIPQNADPDKVIREENQRLKEALKETEFRTNGYIAHLSSTHAKPHKMLRDSLRLAPDYSSFLKTVFEQGDFPVCSGSRKAFNEINEARRFLELPEYPKEEYELVRLLVDSKGKRRRFRQLLK